jgi:peptidoglycan hydrolase CwlO-like protein
MKESINRYRNPRPFFRVLFALLIVSTMGLVTLPAHAGDDEAAAQQAFDNWKAAQAKVKKKQKEVQDTKAELATYLSQIKDDKKITASEQEGLDALNAKLAEEEAELKALKAEMMDAFNALTEALAKLPEDSELRKQLLKERGDLMADKETSLLPQTEQMVQTKTAGGLQVTTFTRPQGRITVNLPADIRAGDTISGTVITEPKGDTTKEKAENKGVLEGTVIDLGGTKIQPGRPTFSWTPPAAQSGLAPRYLLRIVEVGQGTPEATKPQSVVNVRPPSPPDATGASSFNIPPLGQTGRPFVITGPFDGDSSNTKIDYGPALRTPVGAGSGLVVIAESPRQVVVTAPSDSTGPAQIKVNENGAQTISNFRNVGVSLSAPKTNLRKGESTTLKVEVSGLQGITEPVPLHLTKGGVVNMQGGDAQTMSIKPAEVSSSGMFITTRTITGVQAGGWNATATVVVYDICIQDDTNPNQVLLFMSATGDFKFCPGGVSGGTATAPLSSTDFTGGISVQAGDGLDVVTRNGAITAGDFKFAGGQMSLQIDDVKHNGNATVQTTNPKQSFIITDRDMRNNTCTCK